MESIYSIHSRKENSPELFNSTCFYNEDGLFKTGLLKKEDIQLLKSHSIFSQGLRECINCITSVEEADSRIGEILNRKGISLVELLKDKEERNRMILQLRRESTLSLKQIGGLMGGLSESTVSKIISNH
jgi:DNA-directed RNA polymerase specialized sigma subunit